MKLIFVSDNLELYHDPEKELIVQKWFGDLDDGLYKENMLQMIKLIAKLPQIHYHVIYPNLNFSIDPQLQEWTQDNIFLSKEVSRFKKAAFIVPPKVFEELVIEFLSVEQTLDENLDLFKKEYFVKLEDAYKWFEE